MTEAAGDKPMRFARLVATEDGGTVSDGGDEVRSRLADYFADLEPLSQRDSELATLLVERIVDRFLTRTGLKPVHRDEAIAQTAIKFGCDSDGQINRLVVQLPLGSGNPGFEWNGSRDDAIQFADSAADVGAEDIRWDQENVGPTGWE
jgi:hypothetical protein